MIKKIVNSFVVLVLLSVLLNSDQLLAAGSVDEARADSGISSMNGKLPDTAGQQTNNAAPDERFFECGSQRDVIIGALGLYLLNKKDCTPDMFENIVNNELSTKYFDTPPVCPAGGKFQYKTSAAADGVYSSNILKMKNQNYVFDIVCPLHGNIDSYYAANLKKMYNAPEEDKKFRCESNLRTIEGALELFSMEKDKNAESIDELLKGGFLKCVPLCHSKGIYEFIKNDGGDKKACPAVKCSVHGQLKKAAE